MEIRHKLGRNACFGVNPQKQLAELGLGLIDANKTEYSANIYLKDLKLYGKFTTNNEILQLMDLATGVLISKEQVESIFKELENTELINQNSPFPLIKISKGE